MRSSKSRGSTSSSTDKSVNLNAGGYVVQDGSSITITDGGAVENAFEFGSDVITSYEGMAEDSLQFAESSLRSISQSNALAVGSIKELAENLNAGETSDGFALDRVVIYGVVFIVAMSVLAVYLKGKK